MRVNPRVCSPNSWTKFTPSSPMITVNSTVIHRLAIRYLIEIVVLDQILIGVEVSVIFNVVNTA